MPVCCQSSSADQVDQRRFHSCLVSLTEDQAHGPLRPLYEAKTPLSGLVDRAAAGEEIVIAKSGVPQAQLVPLASRGESRKPANAMRIGRIAADTADRRGERGRTVVATQRPVRPHAGSAGTVPDFRPGVR